MSYNDNREKGDDSERVTWDHVKKLAECRDRIEEALSHLDMVYWPGF